VRTPNSPVGALLLADFRHSAGTLEFCGNQVLNAHAQSAGEHDQLPIRDASELGFELSKHLPAHAPTKALAFCGKLRLRKSRGVSQPAHRGTDEVFRHPESVAGKFATPVMAA
jgi:hypothetical protein